MPTLRHLTLARYSAHSSTSSLSRDLTPIPARIDSRFTAGWNAILGPVLAATTTTTTCAATLDVATTASVRPGLQTLAMHCMASVPDERGSLFRVHVPTLAVFLQTFVAPPTATSAATASAVAEKFCGIDEGGDDGNELLAPFVPCILLADECAF